ncbi:MAG: LLM class flavin-dependent oxidoreductase [Chloroflexota bacterium]
MKFGHFFLPTYFPEWDGDLGSYFRFLVDLAVASEELGFDSVWANEHHFDAYGGLVPSPPILLAAVAQRTSAVRLGTSVVVLPLHNPIEVAEQLSMFDLMSGGRLEVGVGRGYVTSDYAAMGVPVAEGQERTLESLEILLRAWRNEPLSYEGRYYRFRDVDVWPKPEQQPPPIWMGCSRNPASFEWTGTQGYRLMTIAHVNPLDELASLSSIYRRAWAGTGRDPDDCQVATHFNALVDEDGDRARELAKLYLGRSMNLGLPTFPESNLAFHHAGAARLVDEGRVLAGSPEECVTALERLQDQAGLTAVSCKFIFGGMPRELAERSMRLFAEGVIPRLKSRQPEPLLSKRQTG